MIAKHFYFTLCVNAAIAGSTSSRGVLGTIGVDPKLNAHKIPRVLSGQDLPPEAEAKAEPSVVALLRQLSGT